MAAAAKRRNQETIHRMPERAPRRSRPAKLRPSPRAAPMTGDDLYDWLERYPWTTSQAAFVLGLSLDGLNKKLTGARSITPQEEMLIAYVEDYVAKHGRPIVALPPPKRGRRPLIEVARAPVASGPPAAPKRSRKQAAANS